MKVISILCGMFLFATISCHAGGWYVGNTAPGEWIQFTNVWLAGGSYRFTANAGSPSAGAAMHMAVDGVPIGSSVAVPDTGRVDAFSPVYLGSATLSQGYHTLQAVFDSSGVSLDWFMLVEDADTTTNVKASDITMVRPPTSGMLISPIIGYEHMTTPNSIFTANDAAPLVSEPEQATNGVDYSDYQLRSWYGVPMYEDFDRRTDRYWDITVDQLIASRAQVPFFHCRETIDFTDSLQDRAYQTGPGSYEGRWLKKFAQAVARNAQAASSLQIGMFMEDGEIADTYYSIFGHYPTGWGDPTLANYAMQYWLEPWFDSVPTSLLYQPIPGRPIISIFSGTPTDLPQDGQMAAFMTNICGQIEARYGLNPLIIVPMDADAGAQAIAWGQAPWLTWSGPMLTMNSYGGTFWDSTSAGSRRRLDTVWAADWNPITDTGTPSGDSAGVDSYQSPLTNGVSVLLTNLNTATSLGTRLVQEEGFYNISEGNRILRSYGSGLPGPGWEWPNQHLTAMSRYADPSTESLMFEAEACDQYYKANAHQNLGGSYRNNWYVPTGLDVFRPLENLNAWTNQSAGPGNLVALSSGFFDVWALDAHGQVWARGIADDTGEPVWTSVDLNGISKFTQLAVGKQFAWALNGNSVYTCQLPYGWDSWTHTTWTSISGNMVQLSVNEGDVWAVDAGGQIYYQRINEAYYPGDTWHPVTGPGVAVNQVYAGGNAKFIWAMSGTNIYYSQILITNLNNVFTVETNMTWTATDNPYNLTQLSIGSEEVWGVNASGNIYRRAVSGAGDWQAVDGNLTQLAVGENYAWGLSGSTPMSRQLSGFLGDTVASIPNAPTGVTAMAGNSSVLLSWTASYGAAGYNIKRGTANGGPYTNVVVATTTNGVDIGLMNGTTYYYVVTAINGTGESTNSTQVSVAPSASGTVPAVPTGLTAVGTNVQVNLNWAASSGATSYNVKRSTVMGGPYTAIETGVASTSYTDTNLTVGTIYYYVISAVNAAGESFANSAEASATPPGFLLSRNSWTASASVNSGNASLAIDGNDTTRWDTAGSQTPGQWFQINMGSTNSFFKLTLDATTNSPNDYPVGYQVNVSDDGVNWGNPVATGSGATSLTTITFPSQTARYVRVTQTGSTGNYWSIYEFNIYSAIINTNVAVTNAVPPTGLNPVSGNGQVALSWNASSGAISYNVKRATVSGGPYTTVASPIGTNYTDTGLSSEPYFYVVSAVNGSGESANSSEVCGTPGAMSRSGWVTSASSTENGGSPANATDGNEFTRWSTGASQTNGQWFEVDMGTAQTFGELVLDAENSAGDYPRGYQVNVSSDGSNWGSPVASGSGNSAVTVISFSPQTARYIRVMQTSSGSTGNWWSIDEFNVYSNAIATVRVEGDLIVNLQSPDLSSSTKVWTNRTSNSQSVGNFTTVGGGDLNVASLTWNSQNVNALYVNGTSANALYSALSVPSEILGAGSVSVELWIYANQVTNNSDILNYGYQAGATHGSDRDFTYDTGENGFSGYFADVAWGSIKPTAGAWEYAVYTFNGSTVNLYVNGVADGSGNVTLTTLATPVELGYFSFNSSNATQVINPFAGYIACARVESGVLTANDITANYALGPAATVLWTPVLVTPLPQLSFGIVGQQLQLQWPSAYLGWELQVQTDAPGIGLNTTNWSSVPGSDLVTSTNFTINPTNGSVLYRLVYP